MPAPARILLPTFGSLGDLHPFMAIAAELQRRGHTPVIATSEFYRPNVENAGLEFLPLPPHYHSSQVPPEQAARMLDPKKGTRHLFREVLMPSLQEAYAALLPAVEKSDLVVAHPIVYAAPLCCEKAGRPWLSAVLTPMVFWSAHDSMFPRGFKGAERLRTSIVAQRLLHKTAGLLTRPWIKEIKALRRELGLPANFHPLLHTPPSCAGTLALFPAELGSPQPDWPANTHQAGYCFYDSHSPTAGQTTSLPPEIEAFLNDGEPPIVFTLGSVSHHDSGNFYVAAVQALRSLNHRALLLLGSQANRPANLPANDTQIAAFDYAPFGALFPRAKIVVHQSGAGTTGQALLAGVPSLAVPALRDDPDNAWRLQRLGVARVMSRQNCTAENFSIQLQELLSNPEYARRARAVSTRLQTENGPSNAVDAIESYLR